MTEVVSPLQGRRLDARFTLLEKLGSGGQGEVWRAHDDTRGIDIALKVPASATAPNQSVLAAFEREHAIAASLEHSSVLKVFPPHRSGDVVVLPMELATGGDLRRLRGAVYLDIIPVLLDIAQALEHAHERGVIHRDLKPGNVLFDARGRVKLADFGAAGTTSTTAADARMQGLSPFTASPEQLRGEAPTVSDDIYGLGALAYELLSGYPPYYPHFDLRRAQEEPVPALVPTRQIPPLLTALVMRMLAKDKNERPRSMREVIDELDVALNDTLAFDFESIVDPAHGAPTAAVLVGPAPVVPRRPTPLPPRAPAGAASQAATPPVAKAPRANAPSANAQRGNAVGANTSQNPARSGSASAGASTSAQIAAPNLAQTGSVAPAAASQEAAAREAAGRVAAASQAAAPTGSKASAPGAAAAFYPSSAGQPSARDASAGQAAASSSSPTRTAQTVTSSPAGAAKAAAPAASTSSGGTFSRSPAKAPKATRGSKARFVESYQGDEEEDEDERDSESDVEVDGERAEERAADRAEDRGTDRADGRDGHRESERADGRDAYRAAEQPGGRDAHRESGRAAGRDAHRAAEQTQGSASSQAKDWAEGRANDSALNLSVIPELLVAHSLVVTPTERKDRWPQVKPPIPASAATSAPAQTPGPTPAPTPASASKPSADAAAAFEAAVAQSRKAHAQTVQNDTTYLPAEQGTVRGGAAGSPRAPGATTAFNDTVYLPPSPASDAAAAFEAAVAQSRKSHAQTVQGVQGVQSTQGAQVAQSAQNARDVRDAQNALGAQNASGAQNDTMQLAPEAPSAPRGVGATWRVTNAQSVNNDTLQLPPETGSMARGAAVLRAAGAHTAQNDTMMLAPESLSAARGVPAASPSAYGQAANEQSIRLQQEPTRTPAPTSASASAVSTQRQAFHAQSVPAAAALPNMANMAAERQASSTAVSEGPARGTYADGSRGADGLTGGPRMIEAPIYTNERPLWETLQLDTVPRVSRLEPIRRRHWPVVLLGLLAGAAVAVFWWLPRYTTQSLPFDLSTLSRAAKNLAPSLTSGSTSTADASTSADTPAVPNSAEAKLQTERQSFDRRLAALETRGAGVWGGPEFGLAKSRAAESVGAHDAGNTVMAQERLTDASHLLDEVESKASQALAAQLAAGQKALAAGQQELADQAFDLAKRIDPNDKRIADGQRRTRNLNGVLPLLADGQNAENEQNFSRAAQDYSQVLSLDPGNDKARAGLARANAAFGDDNYAKAVGSGYAALGAGRLDDARAAFEKARSLRPNGSEAADGLRRVSSALSSKGFSSLRQRAANLEAQERWDEAVQAYDSALQADPSLAFAQEGKDRAAARAELAASMQALIDRPERLSSASLQRQAEALLDTANQQSPSGPVLRSQVTRLGMLLPDYDGATRTGAGRTDLLDKPVRLSLVSDNATAVAIPSIGQFGTFAKRDIQLKPGRYTVIGTRDGFRDIRRDITIAPGQESQTISVSCSDPI